jgi:hypothetical protein
MSEDADRIKRLIAFRKRIETRIGDLETELKELQATLETVNSLLLEKGFKRAEISAKAKASTVETAGEEKGEGTPMEESVTQTEMAAQGASTLKSVTGEVLAEVYVDGDTLHIVPAEDKNFNINTPPFSQFLLQRVLLKMQERDGELARAGQLDANKILCFDITRDGDVIREIAIKNFDSDRLTELKSSVRWTLEKMYEKMKG